MLITASRHLRKMVVFKELHLTSFSKVHLRTLTILVGGTLNLISLVLKMVLNLYSAF